MTKKLSVLLSSIFLVLLFLSANALAEEYIFTTTADFPVPYSSSVKVVNYDHNVYTTESLEDISYLIDLGLVKEWEPMSYSELFDYTPSDKYYESQTNLIQVSVPFAWNKGVFGEGVKIAVIDSGLYNAASDFTFANIHKVADYTPTAQSTNTFCHDEIGHGTMVTGIIAASHNTWGVAGIAPRAEIYVFKCFYLNENNAQVAKNSDIIAAIYSAIDDYGCDIINLSSGTTNSTVFKAVSDYAEQKGVLIVSAAGNYGGYPDKCSDLYYPASYSNVISVGSLGTNGHRASHSQRNDYVNILAPGEDVYTVDIGAYRAASGTSFATPHVVAAAALAKSLNPNLTRAELTDIIFATADEMADRYSGFGSLNVQKLLTYTRATLNPGQLVYSLSGSEMNAYLVPPEGYVSYFAQYESDTLVGIFKNGVSASASDFPYKYYLWKKDTLSPFEGEITEVEY